MSLRIGVAGMRRGLGFAKLIAARKDCRVVAVCDRNRQRAQETAEQVKAEPFDNYDRFCDQPMDAIIIVTPVPTHFECSIKALNVGKHVLCEIPIVFDLDQAEKLAAKVEQTGLKFMTAENVNYFPCIQTIHKIVKEGKIGDVVLAEGEYVHDARGFLFNRDDGLGGGSGTVPSWRDSINPIQYCTHELGPLLMILDDTIRTAVCVDSTFPGEGHSGEIRTQIALFKTQAGRTIRELTAFKIALQPEHHFFCLYGTKGTIETDRYQWYQNLKFYSEENPGQKEWINIPISHVHPDAPPEAHSGGHGTSEYFMVDDFIRSITEDTPPVLDVYKGLDMAVPGICAAESARRCGQLVEVPSFRRRSR
jgi:predicted dehydrogenase